MCLVCIANDSLQSTVILYDQDISVDIRVGTINETLLLCVNSIIKQKTNEKS